MTTTGDSRQQREGQARFQVGSAFYRPRSAIARDLAVLCASLYRQTHARLRVLDAMSGCGVRPLRYVLEAGADWVWANEGNPEVMPILAANLACLPGDRYRLTQHNSLRLCLDCYQRQDFYDLVDIDNFGSPAPHAEAGLWAVRLGGLLYLTSTDGRSSSGHDPQRSLQIYPAYARCHPAAHEQGLRLLLGHIAQVAAARGLGIEPRFSLFTGQVHRVMVRVVRPSTLTPETYGFLAYCHGCGEFQTITWRQLGQVNCPCSQPKIVVSGPLWLGPLHHRPTLTAMGQLASTWGWPTPARLLQAMAAEAHLPPYYYTLAEIGHRGGMDIPRRDRLVKALHQAGYEAAVPHLEAQAIKTNAPLAECLEIARSLPGDQ
ncbi:MAG: tRNA (guanine-N1)-methyltransferase [Cyanobacteria bacterium REEB459]|nr:tRNA (guanine-N1)-methyltransferase [Cyanobacteria bacterium REEB459]